MSEPTHDDPWIVTEEDGEVYCRATRRPDTPLTHDLQVMVNRIRARVEAAAPKRPTTTKTAESPEFIRINNWVLRPGSLSRMSVEQALAHHDEGDLTPIEIMAVWSYLTDPSRCVDLTPQAPKEDAS